MSYAILNTYDNYIDANLHMMQLQEEGINCWLKDENTVTIDPLLTNAIGGIKLMVHETQKDRATDLLRTIVNKAKENRACPYCGSLNVEYIFSNRKTSNWFSAIFTYLLGGYALASEKMYHCFSCEKEFSEIPDKPLEKTNAGSDI
jgi:DNA-directed RNA polymerase subunit RPC12/RpoP